MSYKRRGGPTGSQKKRRLSTRPQDSRKQTRQPTGQHQRDVVYQKLPLRGSGLPESGMFPLTPQTRFFSFFSATRQCEELICFIPRGLDAPRRKGVMVTETSKESSHFWEFLSAHNKRRPITYCQGHLPRVQSYGDRERYRDIASSARTCGVERESVASRARGQRA